MRRQEWRAQALILDRIADLASVNSQSIAWHLAEIAQQIRVRADSWGRPDLGAELNRPAK
jgi:hypothetical protein